MWSAVRATKSAAWTPRQRRVGGGRKGSLVCAQQKLFLILLYFNAYPTARTRLPGHRGSGARFPPGYGRHRPELAPGGRNYKAYWIGSRAAMNAFIPPPDPVRGARHAVGRRSGVMMVVAIENHRQVELLEIIQALSLHRLGFSRKIAAFIRPSPAFFVFIRASILERLKFLILAPTLSARQPTRTLEARNSAMRHRFSQVRCTSSLPNCRQFIQSGMARASKHSSNSLIHENWSQTEKSLEARLTVGILSGRADAPGRHSSGQ
jgi:hypothetical protein